MNITSAAGGVINVRNPDNQAVMSVFGVIDNTIGMSTSYAMQKNSVKNLIKVLGCGIGPTFDITKLRWNRIIISTDADIDGHNITSNLSAFFCDHMPELVEAGYIYKSVPPLYIFEPSTIKKYKINPHIFDKREYFRLYNNIIAKSVDMIRTPSIKERIANIDDLVMTKNEKINWLELNKDYLTELRKIITRIGYDDKISEYFYIVEKICMKLHDILISLYHKNNEKITMEEFMKKRKITIYTMAQEFKEKIEEEFDELKYDVVDQVLEGSYDGNPIAIIVDDVFLKNCLPLIRIMSYNQVFDIGIKKHGSDDDWNIMTIGQVLLLLDNKIKLDVKQRFKGLGEIEADLMFKVVVNPLYRKLIKLTMNDRDSVLDTVYLLHSKKYPEKRRDLLDNTVITYDDIDN